MHEKASFALEIAKVTHHTLIAARITAPRSPHMSDLVLPSPRELKPRILVFGVGGAGGNAVNNMIDAKLQGVEFIVANTDAQALLRSKADWRVQLGVAITEGLGAGARPEVGQAAAQESAPEIAGLLDGAHMVFVAAGMGGGTGTGAAPVIARAARERGILTIAVVTKPFHFEGQRRMQLAETGVQELRKHVDTLIVIPNQNPFRIADDRTTFAEAFHRADQVLYSGVRGVTDLMVMPGLINLDFADVRTVMAEMGTAMMGTGLASGANRSIEAAQAAIRNPLLDITSMKGAKGVLINITGGFDMTLYEVDAAANEIRAEVDANANIILGSTFDETMEGSIRVSVVATGIDDEQIVAQQTVVQPPRTRAEMGARASFSTSAPQPPNVAPVPIAASEPAVRPSFTPPPTPQEAERPGRGFSLFGWMKGAGADGEEPPPEPVAAQRAPEEPVLRERPRPEDADDELEIPAFLRRQMNPRGS
jgi:cell division protein FtsZ